MYFVLEDGTYWLKDRTPTSGKDEVIEIVPSPVKSTVTQIDELHKSYTNAFRESILNKLKRLTPGGFEAFCRELLKVYGFRDVQVTKLSRDGGIDGYGELKIGLSYLHVSFQCKRWNKTSVSRTEIDKFRGAS